MLCLILCLRCRLQTILEDCLIRLIYLSLQCCCDIVFCVGYTLYKWLHVEWVCSSGRPMFTLLNFVVPALLVWKSRSISLYIVALPSTIRRAKEVLWRHYEGGQPGLKYTLKSTVCWPGIIQRSEQGMGRRVMGQMGHENRMGHMGHGSLDVDPWPISFLTLWLGLYIVAMIIYQNSKFTDLCSLLTRAIM